VVLHGLKLADALLKVHGRSWKYYSSFAVFANSIRSKVGSLVVSLVSFSNPTCERTSLLKHRSYDSCECFLAWLERPECPDQGGIDFGLLGKDMGPCVGNR
jgi:hypothetical protein